MQNTKAFSLENLLIAVAGHLGVLALLITSFVILNPMDMMVMSDHVQIMEIDLNQVKVTGDETLVFNTDVPDSKSTKPETKKEPTRKPKDEPLLLGDDKPIENPSLIETKKQDLPKVSEPAATAPKSEVPHDDSLPKAKTVVRVNRETTSLNRTMTVSVVDALRVAMTRCWVFNQNYPGISDIRAVAHLTMNQRGYVENMWIEQESAATENPAVAYIFETIRSAVASCQPFSMLPENEFDSWQKIQLTFYPASGRVQ